MGWDQHYRYNDDDGYNSGIRITFPIITKLKIQYNRQAFYMDKDNKLINKKPGFLEIIHVQLRKINC